MKEGILFKLFNGSALYEIVYFKGILNNCWSDIFIILKVIEKKLFINGIFRNNYSKSLYHDVCLVVCF